jgi:glutamate carboxypeptidase
MKPTESLAYFQSQQEEMVDKLLRWVRFESPTTNKASVDRFAEELAGECSDLGMSLEFDLQANRGNHLVARWGRPEGKILLIGHLDTVWELGTLEKMPARVEGDLAYGPGIFDMKSGIMIALFALRLLRDHGFHRSNITLLLNSDEEEGSRTSQELIEQEAGSAFCVFVLEPAGPGNGLKTKRRGVGQYKITTHGRAAHAGIEPEKGVSANLELAHQIIEVQSWNALRAGISVNANIMHGGSRSNVIPEEAHALVDVRCDGLEDMMWIEEHFRGLTPRNPAAVIDVDGAVDRPPLIRSEQVLALFRQAQEVGTEFNYPLTEFWTGGGSDGNFTAAMGIPTLDGMGAEGAGAHAANEQVVISSLPKRTNLLYQLLRKRIEPPPHATTQTDY